MSLRGSLRPKNRKKGDRQLRSRSGILITDRRRQPRFRVDLPLDYLMESEDHYGGIAGNASKKGLMVYLPEAIPVGTLLSIEILFVEGLELKSIRADVKVVWSDLGPKEAWGVYRYGLEFQSFQEGDIKKLRKLIKEVGEKHKHLKKRRAVR